MKFPVATCAICEEPIWMEMPETSSSLDVPKLQRELSLLTEEHLRSHPGPVQARFWLRRFLDDVPPAERRIAVKEIYGALRALWGDQDSRGVYTIDEALGTAAAHRLWVAANRCSYPACRHAAEPSPDREPQNDGIGWHQELLGRILPPPLWKGTSREWRQLAASVTRYCTCASAGSRSSACSAHRLLADPSAFNRLLFGRRIAHRLELEEFDAVAVVDAATPDRALAA